MYQCIVCRYHEIATKGRNRAMFENKLLDNIRRLARRDGLTDLTLQRIRGRVFLRQKHNAPFAETELAKLKDVLGRAFGLESFSPALECAPSPESLFGSAVAAARVALEKALESASTVSFRTRARRSDKTFPLNSREIEIEMADRLHQIFGDRIKIDLEHPDVSLGIEVREKLALIFHETFRGPGGLPVGSNSDVLALLSGGIDSPVACHMTMKRGCHVDFLTFHSFPYTPPASLEKVKGIAAVLNRYQRPGTLYACNLAELQKLVRDHCEPRYRTLHYRRMMMRIAEKLCRFRRLRAIVTGDSIGQVASQTIANMSVINDVVKALTLRPLAGMDKLECIKRAKQIGTYERSIVNLPDSCTVFAPSSPAVAARPAPVEADEKKIPDLEDALEQAFQTIEKFTAL